jgi:hypothetical protein
MHGFLWSKKILKGSGILRKNRICVITLTIERGAGFLA